MSGIPKTIRDAFAHVKQHHNVVAVTFAQEDEDHGGAWQYVLADGRAPTFGPEIDVSLLEAALDDAWEHRTFPATYRADELEPE